MDTATKVRGKKLIRLVSLLFAAGILAFLFLNAALTLLLRREETSYYENRRLADKPILTGEGLMNGDSGRALDAWVQDHSAGRNTFLRLRTLLDMKLLRRPAVNETVVREDVLLPLQDFWMYSRAELADSAALAADRVAVHARRAEEFGGRYYYVAVPHQAMAFGEEYPPYLQSHTDFYGDIAELFGEALAAREVPFLDMGAVLREEGLLREVSSRIDNHYSILGAYETYRRIMERLRADTGWDLDILEEGEYRIETLPNHYLGSRNRKLFDLWPSEEKLMLLFPLEEVGFLRRDRADWLASPIESREVYSLPASPEEPVSYSLYMGGDWPATEIDTDRPEKPDILVYGDSFTNGVECILWHGFDTMYSFDFRHYTEKTLDELIEELRPDAVICIRDYEALIRTEGNGQ